jgi:hypothetical protein
VPYYFGQQGISESIGRLVLRIEKDMKKKKKESFTQSPAVFSTYSHCG